ncbi:MAG: S9 family peptidase [Gammaproteobacteria bacterium]|nr:S9 family peptidase [Gammaproteobacteria bacterium]MBU2057050.1 S9 family peptidase [Gammaproteobacteria bacterium]MBU2175109.1 S9 family peptidase [Gammaproteobacteria bacterium]MBU2245140.1 S9 family peptidase [Gammaproteobacteria bacterium]MBU2343993.1 S9 family peptidase [Gammaproteobacteria bacterium]
MAAMPSTAPVAPTKPYVVKSEHGDRQDPYYWLRDDKRQAPEVLAYLNAENQYYQQYADHYKTLNKTLADEIIGRVKQDDSTVPAIKGDYSYYTRFEQGKEYPIYARTAKAGGAEQVMLDLNLMAQGKDFYKIGNYQVSPDQQLLAYAEDTTGRRNYNLKVRDLRTGKDLPTVITGAEASLAWSADNSQLFYIEKDPQTLLGTKVRRHTLGQAVAKDELLYEEKDSSFYMGVGNSADDQYVVIWLESTVSNEMLVLKSDDTSGKFTSIAPRQRDFKYEVEHLDNRWVIKTDWDAPNYRLMTVTDDQIGDRSRWQPLLAHNPDVFIDSFQLFTDYLVINERSNGLDRVRLMPWSDLSKARYVESDEAAYVAKTDNNPEQNSQWLRYRYTSLTTPSSVYEMHMKTGEKRLLKEQEVLGGFDKNNYQTERVWATAQDGTKIPVSLLYKKGLKKDGTAPLYQYAYGSYGISSSPSFRSPVISLVDRGFVYAIAHIRGGQEMGRAWYENGKLLKKVNTFTDFIDVTDYLVTEKYAAKDKVFAMGGSAGGLLMGAIANMAPQKYRGLVAHVPFVDVVTTMLDESIPLTTNEFDEWGNPKQKAYYDYMLSYSPYDQLKKQAYPAMLVTTGLHDSQVQYFEPAKWVAKLRTIKTDQQPLLFRTTMEAGHGGKSGRFSRLTEVADEYAFILSLLPASPKS